jgi:hypothetical protein
MLFEEVFRFTKSVFHEVMVSMEGRVRENHICRWESYIKPVEISKLSILLFMFSHSKLHPSEVKAKL